MAEEDKKNNHVGSHKDWINTVLSDEQYAEEWEAVTQKMPNGAIVLHPDKYKKEYDEIAFKVMTEDDASLARVCATLQCSRPTLLQWIKRHPSFRVAIENGRQIGEDAFRKKIREHAFDPTANVNNGLIKMLAKNVHDIDADEASIIIHNHQSQNVLAADKETASLYAEALGRKLDEE
jgi:hypothetical protein